MKHLFTIIVVALVTIATFPAMATSADEGSQGASISDFKAQSVFRAVELQWKVATPYKKEVSFQILRSDSFAEGPYEEIATVPYNKENTDYSYYDKAVPSESTYYYKLVVIGGGETYGPVSARPFFSLPAT
jgi:fibronectin type 3 domain-containing protein